jgi:putative nucleotidyltransferase with HDIG domain
VTRRDDAGYGKGQHTFGAEDALLAVVRTETAARLRERFASPEYRPPVLPGAALEVHRLARLPTEQVDLPAVVKLVAADPLLAAGVLKRASAAIGGSAAPRSLHEAVMRVGLNSLRDLVWEVALDLKVFRCKQYAGAMQDLQRHSIAVAKIAARIAAETSIAEDYAFLAGLLHDIGLAASLVMLAEPGPAPALEEVAADLDAIHEEASGIVASLWKLPPDLQLVIAHHHSPSIGGYDHPAVALVCLAEFMANDLGFGLPEPFDRASSGVFARSMAALGLDDAQFRTLRNLVASRVRS